MRQKSRPPCKDFDDLLQAFCRPWFEVLYNENRYLETVQIEGHASSEYGNLGLRQAFDENLDLSQRRASAVFKKCLDYGGNDEVSDWARSKMAAIGYSSAQPVLKNGVEDRQASRRVVFAIDMKSEGEVVDDTVERIGELSELAVEAAVNPQVEEPEPIAEESELSESPQRSENVDAIAEEEDQKTPLSVQTDTFSGVPGPEYYEAAGYSPLRGRLVTVRDGDTIVVNGVPVRLEGLHAPEISTTRGKRAAAYMNELVRDREVNCWLAGEKSYDRQIGVCFIDAEDLAELIIKGGLGADCIAYSGGRYSSVPTDSFFRPENLPGYCGL